MAHSRRITKVKDCIAYIEKCGWILQYYNRPWYIFKSPETEKEIIFTLTEIRDAYNNGW